MATLNYEANPTTVQNLINLHEDGHLNLSPGFQREGVWTLRDRAKLIDSVIRNYPLPSIFLYKRQQDGEIVYDVIDGKQRLESILMFTGDIWGQKYWAKVQLPDDDEKEWVDWKTLCQRKQQHLITGYKLQTIEVSGDLADVIDLFVRINSTGKALTSAEKRHAKYYRSGFLKTAGKLAARYEEYFRKSKILSVGQIGRMKHVELICELMISIHQGDVINKKAALDRVMAANSFTEAQTRLARDKTIRALNRIKKMFPKLGETRFHQVSDFYSLVVLVAKFETEGLILTDPARNKLAWGLLSAFSTGVDTVRDLQKQAKGPQPGQEQYREYLLTVTGGTDDISRRRQRENMLRGVLQSLFEKKDVKRLFSPEQRRILWNSATIRKCAVCGKPVTWDDLALDHVDPFSKGGRTDLDNAALTHSKCNSKKGNKK